MKSILRKIRVGNRTQAAIWALEHSYSGEEPKAAALKANGAAEQTYIVPSPSPTARQLPRLALISKVLTPHLGVGMNGDHLGERV